MCVLRAGVEGQAGKTQGGRRGRGKSSGAGSTGVTGFETTTEPQSAQAAQQVTGVVIFFYLPHIFL